MERSVTQHLRGCVGLRALLHPTYGITRSPPIQKPGFSTVGVYRINPPTFNPPPTYAKGVGLRFASPNLRDNAIASYSETGFLL
ncbi:hypothetical protein K4A83_22020, partial [Spirulina subsalsa FACHB-351]